MARNRSIDAVGGGDDEDRVRGRAAQWQRYLDHQDALAAEEKAGATGDPERHLEEEAKAGRIAIQPAARLAPRLDQDPHAPSAGPSPGRVQSPGAAAGREAALLAMQMEALARLDLTEHAGAVNAAVRAADGLDVAPQVTAHAVQAEQRMEGRYTDREQQKRLDAPAAPDDYVRGVKGREQRSADERLSDRDHHRAQGFGGSDGASDGRGDPGE